MFGPWRGTVDFYSNILGMPLIKSLDLPAGQGQHFFFDRRQRRLRRVLLVRRRA
ncbi:putative glyoxalase/bleomycin resistance protein/dioxygenase [Mycobacterium kansasii 662]|uniref:Putative glyoxalase/bleomycin resistance protein/dioxygenase n=1 Tax=Mycobacterium kansasii 662 TaxID=1299326 RepID=X7XPZ8_MYCKA|nr:putative glyoxalase/bleomycin resistance protein/dioxygenase [Mycobacterium kansasii 662]